MDERNSPARGGRTSSRRSGLVIASGLAIAIAIGLGYRVLRAPARPAEERRVQQIPSGTPDTGSLPPLPLLRPQDRARVDCDHGAAARDPDPDAATRRERPSARVLDAIAAELAGRAEPAERALGVYLQLVNGMGDVHARFAQNNPQCTQEPSCGPLEDAAVAQATRPYLDALVHIAVTGKDAGAYQIAFLACNSADAAGASGGCAQLSARQWAQLEPENAQPWLFIAGEAARQSQPSLVAEALYRASQAPRDDSHWNLYAKMLDASALQGQGADVRTDVTFAAFGMTIAGHFAPFQPVFSYCAADALADPNRRQVCDDLAHLFAERSDTLIGMVVAIKLGERLGWPAVRLDEMRDARDAASQLAAERVGSDPESCASQERQREFIVQMLAHGEMGALRRLLAASGQTPAQLARRHRAAATGAASSAAPVANGTPSVAP